MTQASGYEEPQPAAPTARSHAALLLAAVALASLMLAGCPRQTEETPTLLVYCGAGIRPPIAEMAAEFGQEHGVVVECDYAGSNVLFSRIKLSGRGDVFIPGDRSYVEQAEEADLIVSAVDACYFVPVILVPKGNPQAIESVADLARPGIRIGFGDPEACAIGRVTDKILEKNGVDLSQVAENIVFRSLTVNELGVQVKAGKIEATIVWDAIAAGYSEEGEVVAIPAEDNVISTVPVAVLRSSQHPELAESFQAFVTSPRGRDIFAAHHYTTESPW
ncbi:MAG: molybdate ABC transporter substrate-binding protein [Armatimonadota bacterium]